MRASSFFWFLGSLGMALSLALGGIAPAQHSTPDPPAAPVQGRVQLSPEPPPLSVNTDPKKGPVQLSTPPVLEPDTTPQPQNPGSGSSLSPDSHGALPDYLQYEPYNVFPRELNLWNLEGKRHVRSAPVIAPDKSRFAYSEVLFMPNTRQTMSRLFLVDVPPPPAPPTAHLPSQQALHPTPAQQPDYYLNRFEPDKTIQGRQQILSVGYDRVNPFEFRTLTIVDWSFSGQRLLFKQRSGVLHVGLRVSDILIYDQNHGTVTIYPELHRVIRYYWETQGNLPHIEQLAWDMQPLGWEAHSDTVVLINAWAYDRREKKFLGLWRYDIDAQRTELVSLDNRPVAVAANGWLASPMPQPPPSASEQHGKRFRKRAKPVPASGMQSL